MGQGIFVHLPYGEVMQRLDALEAAGVFPEIYLPAHLLEELSTGSLEQMAAVLKRNGSSCTLHGPFLDLNAGSGDESIRKATLARYAQAFAAAEILHPVQMVLHPGYDRWHYGGSEDGKRWLQQSLKSWEWALEETEALGLSLVLENVFEHRPQILGQLLRRVDSDRLRFCFDVGHCNLFSAVPIREWMDELAPYLAEVHLHDNLGEEDDHLAIGEGEIDFAVFFRDLREMGVAPHFTIEAFNEKRVRMSLQALQRYLKGEKG
ncbi:MAG: sugar phosphate isomerase/epimerase family protein [candidate division NC10 bacterium]|nr:sugar phosphate isomerase/epimerase family protein [candidate division NC10 bacterium]